MTLIQPASKWMHWATPRCHSDLLWAATSASFQVIPMFNESLLTVLLQFVRGRPGPLLNPRTSRAMPVVEVCAGDPFVSHVQASEVFFYWVSHPYCDVLFWLWPLHLLLCPSKMLLCHPWWAAFSLFVSGAVRGHTSAFDSALYRRVALFIMHLNIYYMYEYMCHLF